MVMMKIGRAAFGFVLVVSILSSIFVAACLAAGVQPPSVLWFASINPPSMIKSLNSTVPSNPISVGMSLVAVAAFIWNFGWGILAGVPIMFYRIAAMLNIPSLAPAALVLGSILQAFALYYIVKLFWGFISGDTNE